MKHFRGGSLVFVPLISKPVLTICIQNHSRASSTSGWKVIWISIKDTVSVRTDAIRKWCSLNRSCRRKKRKERERIKEGRKEGKEEKKRTVGEGRKRRKGKNRKENLSPIFLNWLVSFHVKYFLKYLYNFHISWKIHIQNFKHVLFA